MYLSIGPSSQKKIWEVKSTLFSPARSFMTDTTYPWATQPVAMTAVVSYIWVCRHAFSFFSLLSLVSTLALLAFSEVSTPFLTVWRHSSLSRAKEDQFFISIPQACSEDLRVSLYLFFGASLWMF